MQTPAWSQARARILAAGCARSAITLSPLPKHQLAPGEAPANRTLSATQSDRARLPERMKQALIVARSLQPARKTASSVLRIGRFGNTLAGCQLLSGLSGTLQRPEGRCLEDRPVARRRREHRPDLGRRCSRP